jgi:hypothetical protein
MGHNSHPMGHNSHPMGHNSHPMGHNSQVNLAERQFVLKKEIKFSDIFFSDGGISLIDKAATVVTLDQVFISIYKKYKKTTNIV